MFPVWNSSTDFSGMFETLDQVLKMHMEECNKSAVILQDGMTIQLYNTLKMTNKPVYLGMDIVNENLNGYKYFGYFSTKVIMRSKHFFQSGILEWWQKFFNWYLIIKTRSDRIRVEQNAKHEGQSQEGIYLIFLIPVTGLLLSIIVFIIFDRMLFKIASKTHKSTRHFLFLGVKLVVWLLVISENVMLLV